MTAKVRESEGRGDGVAARACHRCANHLSWQAHVMACCKPSALPGPNRGLQRFVGSPAHVLDLHVLQCPAHRVGSDQGTDHLMFESCSSTRGSRLKGKKDSAACYAVTERWRASRRKRSPSALALAAAASPIWNAAHGAFHIRTPPRVWQQHLSWAEPSGWLLWPPAGHGGLGRLGATGVRRAIATRRTTTRACRALAVARRLAGPDTHRQRWNR
jgi:hypothetical protein